MVLRSVTDVSDPGRAPTGSPPSDKADDGSKGLALFHFPAEAVRLGCATIDAQLLHAAPSHFDVRYQRSLGRFFSSIQSIKSLGVHHQRLWDILSICRTSHSRLFTTHTCVGVSDEDGCQGLELHGLPALHARGSNAALHRHFCKTKVFP
jgi:hypothetical protein